MKNVLCTTCGAVGSAVACALGGWDEAVISLLIFMGIDYFSGLVCAGVFHKSKKSESGALESKASFKGLVKKCMILLFVVIANRLDVVTGSTFIRDAVCIAFMVNELISIVENAGLMGIPIPQAITNGIEILKNKEAKS